MRIKLALIIIFLTLQISAQNRIDYLSNNRVDLRTTTPNITEHDFNIIGFGALHGSSKPYEAELSIIKTLLEKDLLDFYIIEANFSQAFFLQQYLETGDEELLTELTYAFQTMVSQEGTIETFNHWKAVREIQRNHPETKLKIIGCDVVNEYYFPIKQILSLSKANGNWTQRQVLKKAIDQEDLNTTIWNKELNEKVKLFVQDYLSNKERYSALISDIWTFEHVINSINYNFQDKREREKIIFDNYIDLKEKYDLASKKQFAKYGYGHLQKFREGNYPSFFTRLIENDIYPRENVITIIGYMTKSKVLWDKKYNKQGDYKGYTTKAGYGISDCWRERFKGIKNLKQTKLSDLTMYTLNQKDSPYFNDADLVEIKMFLKDHNTTKLKGKNTLQFIDYAILISDSKEQTPIEERK